MEEIKKKLCIYYLTNTVDNNDGTITLTFEMDGKKICIDTEVNEEMKNNEFYFDNENTVNEIIKNSNNIEIK
ncbi:MAG: hypothetical protein E7J62_05885 [Serratia marcescens]|nr:hypothetical protein [Serratia marcescens]